MQHLQDQISILSERYFEETVAMRRYFHQHPELSEQEFNTAKYIKDRLKQYGIEYQMYLEDKAIVALIEGKNTSSKVIALRADMDALPIEEENDLDFRSLNKGIMHACGHDVHIASLLTTARILYYLKNKWNGSVKLIFQPSEEKFPGGAIQLIGVGVLENPKVSAVLGLHVSPEIETGKIGMKSGNYMASTDEIYITVTGKGGHAAIPEMVINPLLIASKMLLELDDSYSKSAPKDSPSVLTFGRITGDGKTNIVPDKVYLEGTLRTFNETWRTKAHQLIADTANTIAQKMKGNAQLHIAKGYPVLTNDEVLTAKTFSIAQEFLGKENVLSLNYRMTAEDFAYYSRFVPSVFYRLGTRIEGYDTGLHSSSFRVNEEALRKSPALMAYLAIKLLEEI
ncbi:MAG: amidohydrolase [Bacteroidales bacterium]|jgi:amidohydrolase|nr:amidohydrolase [Bacteroidales bacterium]